LITTPREPLDYNATKPVPRQDTDGSRPNDIVWGHMAFGKDGEVDTSGYPTRVIVEEGHHEYHSDDRTTHGFGEKEYPG